MNTSIDNRSNKVWALSITFLFHVFIIFILWFTVMQTPDPPLSGGEGMVVNLGYVEESTGDIQPMSSNPEEKPILTKEELTAVENEHENVVTQNIEETEKITIIEKKVKQKIKPEEKKESAKEEIKKIEETKPIEEVKKVNPALLYKGKNNNATSQGNSNKGTGDQGDPNGDPNAKNYGVNTGTGNTPGNGGIGDGGDGNGQGKGINVNLESRKVQSLIKPDYTCNESGSVVVTIYVDRNGKVIKAVPGARGSTTASTCLYNKAKEAAMNTRFDANSAAPEEQKGSIKYNFTLR